MATELLVAVAIAAGVVGVVVPVIPGVLLVWAAIGAWAVAESTTSAWVAFAVVTGVVVASQVLKYVLPGRKLRAAGVPSRTMVIGAVAGIIGFFVIPVVGVVVGFVGGVYAAERARLGDHDAAWRSARHSLTAAGLSMLIELAAVLVCATVWVTAAFIL